jgi:putative flippase GtrA
MQAFLRQIGCFIAVGCAAAATHWATAVGGIAVFALPPALANLIGWSIALLVSFSGHYLLTFRYQTKSLWPALRRFLLISGGGFAINEFAFVFLLKTTDIPYYWLLAIILVAVAGLTFVLSRYWAFRHKA